MTFRVGTWRPITKHISESRRDPIGLILHVQDGNFSPWGWFQDDRAGGSADFWVSKEGRIEQYADPDVVTTWAQIGGNDLYASVETEGYPGEALTAAQIEGVATIYRAGMDRYGWPAIVQDTPGLPGLGAHSMGGGVYGRTTCPGSLRLAQRADIMALLAGDEDMPITDDDAKKVAFYVLNGTPLDGPQGGILASWIKAARQDAGQARIDAAAARALGEQAAAKASGLTIDQVKQAVADAIASQVQVTGDLKVVPR